MFFKNTVAYLKRPPLSVSLLHSIWTSSVAPLQLKLYSTFSTLSFLGDPALEKKPRWSGLRILILRLLWSLELIVPGRRTLPALALLSNWPILLPREFFLTTSSLTLEGHAPCSKFLCLPWALLHFLDPM